MNHMTGPVFVRKYFGFISTGAQQETKKEKSVESKKKEITLRLSRSSDNFILKKLK